MNTLKGNRTYIIVLLGFAYLIAVNQGWLKPIPEIGPMITLAAIGFLRSAVGARNDQAGAGALARPASWPPEPKVGFDVANKPGAQQTSVGSPSRPTLPPAGPTPANVVSTFALGILVIFLVCGCAHVSTENRETFLDTNGVPITRVSRTKIFTFFDSKSELTKFANGQTEKGTQRTTIGGLNQESSATNVVGLIQAVSAGATEGALRFVAPKP